MQKTRRVIITALLAALTFVTTYFIRIPTPTMGYIHPGDALVLLSGLFLGPVAGGFAAGLGAMLSDVVAGYISYAPATFIIKFLTAAIASVIARWALKLSGGHTHSTRIASLVFGGIFGEAWMVIGYFVFEIFLLGFSTGGGFTQATITAGIAASGAGIPFNIVQGIFGVILSTVLYPILKPLYNQVFQN